MDNDREIKLMLSIIDDLRKDVFHMDYLLAAITALLWFRCIMLLRLSEVFGPLLEMIYAMVVIFMQFMLLYILELVVFASIAGLTLSDMSDFNNIFEALRTYLEASLGEFDLHTYDSREGFEHWFGLLLHILVLFVNMILIINLLIAIMSDTYSRMSNRRLGLYWATVIKEMPKYRYHDKYGVLVMLPFLLSWIGFLCVPLMYFVKSQRRIKQINDGANKFVYGIYSVFLTAVFMAVNLALVPFAYVKTLYHKLILYQHYRGSDQLRNCLVFALIGLPLLLASQVTDVYYFLRHTFRSRQQK